jgi:diguanylate cyclase (GGDEF)-like protein
MVDALTIAQLQGLLAHAPLLFFSTDCDYKFRTVAGAGLATLHIDPRLVNGRDATQFFEKEKPAAGVGRAFLTARRGKDARFTFTHRGIVYNAQLHPIIEDHETVAIVGVATQSDSRSTAELAVAQRALEHAEAIATIASYTIDVETEACDITPGFARLFGFPEETRRIHFGEMLARIHPDDKVRFTRARAAAIAHASELNFDFRVVRPSGDVRYVRSHASYFTSPAGIAVRGVGVVHDETQALEAQRGLEYIAMHDPLTGVLNRSAFDRQARAAIAQSEASHRGVALLFMDLDGFSEVNDVVGHGTGDQILRAIAERLRSVRGADHTIGRMGGDEFAMLFGDVRDHRETEARVAEVRSVLRAPISVGGVEYTLTASIGVAMFNVHQNETAVLTHAHMAMLGAKAAGRSRVMWYTPDLERLMTMRHRIERDLSTSLDEDQLAVHYQPIYDAVTNDLTAVEALLRWNHPELGMIAPTSFLDVAVQSGQLPSIGEWVLEQACRAALELSQLHGRAIRVNVNVSPEQLQTPLFNERVSNIVREVGVEPSQIQIEVTEQSLINDVEHAARVLTQLRNDGFSIAIDDFGTGYNTLSYLKSYPVSCLKIDRMFIRDCESDDYSRAICRSLTALASSLGLLVIGEGIETAGQDAFLREVGVHELQGFYYGKPVPLHEL